MNIRNSMTEVHDWGDYKKRTLDLLNNAPVDKVISATVKVLIAKGDNNVSSRSKAVSAIKTMLEDYVVENDNDSLRENPAGEGDHEERPSGFRCTVCDLKMHQKKTPQICSECLIDEGGSGSDPDLDSHFPEPGEFIVRFDDDED